jgi:hypothetical protein
MQNILIAKCMKGDRRHGGNSHMDRSQDAQKKWVLFMSMAENCIG